MKGEQFVYIAISWAITNALLIFILKAILDRS